MDVGKETDRRNRVSFFLSMYREFVRRLMGNDSRDEGKRTRFVNFQPSSQRRRQPSCDAVAVDSYAVYLPIFEISSTGTRYTINADRIDSETLDHALIREYESLNINETRKGGAFEMNAGARKSRDSLSFPLFLSLLFSRELVLSQSSLCVTQHMRGRDKRGQFCIPHGGGTHARELSLSLKEISISSLLCERRGGEREGWFPCILCFRRQ